MPNPILELELAGFGIPAEPNLPAAGCLNPVVVVLVVAVVLYPGTGTGTPALALALATLVNFLAPAVEVAVAVTVAVVVVLGAGTAEVDTEDEGIAALLVSPRVNAFLPNVAVFAIRPVPVPLPFAVVPDCPDAVELEGTRWGPWLPRPGSERVAGKGGGAMEFRCGDLEGRDMVERRLVKVGWVARRGAGAWAWAVSVVGRVVVGASKGEIRPVDVELVNKVLTGVSPEAVELEPEEPFLTIRSAGTGIVSEGGAESLLSALNDFLLGLPTMGSERALAAVVSGEAQVDILRSLGVNTGAQGSGVGWASRAGAGASAGDRATF